MSVLLLCVMLVASATAFAWFVKLQIESVTQGRELLRARGVAYMLQKEAMRGLALDTNDYDSPLEDWFKPMFIPLRNYGLAKLMLIPLDDKIPLNGLFLPDGVTLRNELKNAWDKVWAELGRRDLAVKVLDFIDKDPKPRLGGYEGDESLNRAPLDISELLAMGDMTPELLYGNKITLGLADYCTMWAGNKININTAPAHVLSQLDGLNKQLADDIIALRRKEEIQSLDDLKKISGFPQRAIPVLANIIGFTSSYYNLKIELVPEGGGSGKFFDVIIEKKSGIVRWEER